MKNNLLFESYKNLPRKVSMANIKPKHDNPAPRGEYLKTLAEIKKQVLEAQVKAAF